ncbi:hypothetical protein [Novosphingobium sp. 9U]|uniref:hypothetical protein n=1 Tax=Novosphingobium sp. 9U TaxID=2653158 RepID=UPI0012F1A843|nr:hypothetical protein [Novosphingobium sp. 9U]VWX47353.1 conserved hypothetical protein [Novosphingobium sp. 9U]
MIRDLHPHTRPQRTRNPDHVGAHARKLGFEPRDWPVKPIAWGFVALLTFVGVVALGMGALVRWLQPSWPKTSALVAARQFRSPAPPLESAPRIDREHLDAAQVANLRRAPKSVEQAMQETAVKGWHDAEPKP